MARATTPALDGLRGSIGLPALAGSGSTGFSPGRGGWEVEGCRHEAALPCGDAEAEAAPEDAAPEVVSRWLSVVTIAGCSTVLWAVILVPLRCFLG